MAHPVWPLFDLVVRTPRLELRIPDDDLVLQVCDLIGRHGLHRPGQRPFSNAWTELPDEERDRQTMQHHWRSRAGWGPDRWELAFVALVDGEPVGQQSMTAERFGVLRSVTTGSWLALPHHGQGLGREMREAVLHLAFEGLGAAEARSAAFADNAASIGVSRSVGYEDDGTETALRDGEAALHLRFRMVRERWVDRRRSDIEVRGLEPCLALLGAATGG